MFVPADFSILPFCIFRFLGYVDKIGTAFEAPYIATGYGAYLATPIIAKAYDENPNLNYDEALTLMKKCIQVLYYRDCCASSKVNFHHFCRCVNVFSDFQYC